MIFGGLAAWARRSLPVVGAALAVVSTGFVKANGGSIFYKERIRDYSVSVAVEPAWAGAWARPAEHHGPGGFGYQR